MKLQILKLLKNHVQDLSETLKLLTTLNRLKISENLNQHAKEIGSKILVNCASNEYFNAINLNSLLLRVITPIFMERKNGKEKIISFYAKNARGAMARFIIQNRLKSEEDIKKFDLDGYKYVSEKSSEDKPVFIR